MNRRQDGWPPRWRAWIGKETNSGLTRCEERWFAQSYHYGIHFTPDDMARSRAAYDKMVESGEIVVRTIPRCTVILDDGTECRNHIYLVDAINCLEHRVRLDGPTDTTRPS